jgi:hypothetical protein
MRIASLLPLCAALLLPGSSRIARAEELPPAAKETLDAYEKEAAEVQKKVDEEIRKSADNAAAKLKILQDKFCKEAKLDEAVAIRDQIRLLRDGETQRRVADLPAAAREVLDDLDKLQQKAEQRLQKIRDKADAQLKTIQTSSARKPSSTRRWRCATCAAWFGLASPMPVPIRACCTSFWRAGSVSDRRLRSLTLPARHFDRYFSSASKVISAMALTGNSL